MSIFTASSNSVVLGDLYSLQQLIYESGIGFGRFYFKLEEGSFQRPSYYIKVIESNLGSRHRSFRQITSQIMVQYFTEDYYEAQVVSNDLQILLSGGQLFADVVLPRYDFSVSPPAKQSVSGWDADATSTLGASNLEGGGTQAYGVMGARIDPTTINNGGIIQEDNRAFNVPITFSMTSPLPSFQNIPTMENISWEILTGQPVMAQVLRVCTRGVPSIEQTEAC